MPLIRVDDVQGRAIATIYAWPDRADLIAIEQSEKHGGRQNYGSETHAGKQLTAIGRWFGLRLLVDLTRRRVTGYVRAERGQWIQLNKTPLPYMDDAANGVQLRLVLGSRKLGDADNNLLEMDEIRVTQVSVD